MSIISSQKTIAFFVDSVLLMCPFSYSLLRKGKELSAPIAKPAKPHCGEGRKMGKLFAMLVAFTTSCTG